MNIFVSNLSFSITDEDLRNSFSQYGEVSSVKIINDRETGRSRGFGFVDMPDDNAAKQAIAELNGTTMEGRSIKAVEAQPKESRPSGGGGYQQKNSGYKNRY